jgi:hypothetical protein
MVAARRTMHHWLITALGCPSMLAVVLLVHGMGHSIPPALVWFMTAAAAGLTALHLLADLWNHNLRRKAHLRWARQQVRFGLVEVLPLPVPGAVPRPARSPCVTAYFLLGLSVPLVASPELIAYLNGWPRNDDCRPCVAGPGDDVRIYLPDRIAAVKGLWHGAAVNAHVTNADELGVPDLKVRAVSRTQWWGETLEIDPKQPDTQIAPWAEVRVPSLPELVGKDLQLHLSLSVTYPKLERGNKYQDTEMSCWHNTTLRLADVRAGKIYELSWWWGTLGGGALFLFLSYWITQLAATACENIPPPRFYPTES